MEDEPTSTQPLLTGETSTLSASVSSESPLGAAPSNVQFVTGPDGQMVAIQNEPFVWKQFFIGFGVPMIFMILPMLLIIIASTLVSNGDPHERHDLTMNKGDGTAYYANFSLEDDVWFHSCQLNSSVSCSDNDEKCDECHDGCSDEDYQCHDDCDENDCNNPHYSRDQEQVYLYKGDVEGGRVIVGNWTRSTGNLTFDDGSDYGESITITIDTEIDYSEDDDYNTANNLQAFSGILCCGFPIIGLVLTVIGFSSGRKALGVGGAIALASFPFVGFAFFIFSIEMVGL